MQCHELTESELADLVAQGYVVQSGPHATQDECLAVCGGSSSSSSGLDLGGMELALDFGFGDVDFFAQPFAPEVGLMTEAINSFALTDCACTRDGFCARYQRPMAGRLRAICRGEDCDPGTAQQMRDQWAREATAAPKVVVELPTMPAPCPHLGAHVVESGQIKLRECLTCKGNVRSKVRACTHPALAPHETTDKDCQTCLYRPLRQTLGTRPRPLILMNHLSPGDVLCMTAAVHALHRAQPGKFVTAVSSSCPAIWEHNPDVVPIEEARRLGAEEMQTHYPAVHQSDQRAIHMMQAYCEFFEQALRVKVPLLTNKPLIYLSKRERSWTSQIHDLTGQKQKFWLICAGRKHDYTAKFWGTHHYQELVDSLRGQVQFVQVGKSEHHHPTLDGVINLVDQTTDRQLIRLAYHAEGGVGGVTFLHHLMAAMSKPYVCVAGGREPVPWNAYPKSQFLHTIGMLSCCAEGGCWKSRVEPLPDDDHNNRSLCVQPVSGLETVPRCLTMISPEVVRETILRVAM